MTVMDWAEWGVIVAAVGVLLFLLIYGLLAPWYRSRIGRALMAEALSVFLLLGLSLLSFWFHFSLNPIASNGVIWFIAIAQVAQAYAVGREQIGGWRRTR